MMLNGEPMSLKQHYRVALNEFIAQGGDNFSAFTQGTDRTVFGLDLDALVAYFGKHSPVQPPALDRVKRIR